MERFFIFMGFFFFLPIKIMLETIIHSKINNKYHNKQRRRSLSPSPGGCPMSGKGWDCRGWGPGAVGRVRQACLGSQRPESCRNAAGSPLGPVGWISNVNGASQSCAPWWFWGRKNMGCHARSPVIFLHLSFQRTDMGPGLQEVEGVQREHSLVLGGGGQPAGSRRA